MQGASVSGWLAFIWKISSLFRPNRQGSDPSRCMFQCFNMTQHEVPPPNTYTNQAHPRQNTISADMSASFILPDLLELELKKKARSRNHQGAEFTTGSSTTAPPQLNSITSSEPAFPYNHQPRSQIL
jgi:hypothetical protein